MNDRQHYTVISPWNGKSLGCIWDEPYKDGSVVIDERDAILKSSSPGECVHCRPRDVRTIMEIVEEGKK